MLGVPEELIKKSGAVSQPVALTMALGALERSGGSLAFSITGLAGPDKNGEDAADETPTGTVWIGLAGLAGNAASPFSEAKVFRFKGSRNEVREAAATVALEEVLKKLLYLGSR